MLRRLKVVLPTKWFADKTPILDTILAGPSEVLCSLHGKISWITRQVRLRSADGPCLDDLVTDYLGTKITRRTHEDDTSFRDRVCRELLRERGTRHAVVSALHELTGRRPALFEPRHPSDTGAYGDPSNPSPRALAYGLQGGWGSLSHPYQCFITAFRPLGAGTAPGFGWGGGAYNIGHMAYADQSIHKGRVSDDDIMTAIQANLPLGTVAWLRIDS